MSVGCGQTFSKRVLTVRDNLEASIVTVDSSEVLREQESKIGWREKESDELLTSDKILGRKVPPNSTGSCLGGMAIPPEVPTQGVCASTGTIKWQAGQKHAEVH